VNSASLSGAIARLRMVPPAISLPLFSSAQTRFTSERSVNQRRFLMEILPAARSIAFTSTGARICFNASIFLAGAFPLMHVISKLLMKPMSMLGKKLGINATSALCLLPNLVTNATTFGMMKDMDKKGAVLNSALAVTVAWTFGSHLGFTMSYNEKYALPMIVAKLASGVAAIALALLLYKDKGEYEKEETEATEN